MRITTRQAFPTHARALDPTGTTRSPQARHAPAPWSRRRLVHTTAGLVAAGAVLGPQLWRPRPARADGADPVPIPGGSPLIVQLVGQLLHAYGPGAQGFDPPDAEPATIGDFTGEVGLAYISGMCRRTHTTTGAVRELPFQESDMRFMQGAYRGMDGQVHRGTFAFI